MAGRILETERLLLRPMTLEDADLLVSVFGDPRVMAVFDAKPMTRDEVRRWVQRNLDHQERYGFGLFSVLLKDFDALIGDCGVRWRTYEGEEFIELGYDVRSDMWNKGYATEAAVAVRDYALEELGLRPVMSSIRAGNAASIRVAEKLGMERWDEIERDDVEYVRYRYEGAGST